MKNLYNISKGQFITLWVFSVLIWIRIINHSCAWYASCSRFNFSDDTEIADWLSFIIPFLIIFYTIGWINHRKEIKGK